MEYGNKEDMQRLCRAFLCIRAEEECSALLEDLFTIGEIGAACQRLKVAGLLREKKTCQSISAETGASTATISRVNCSLNYGTGAYRMVLKRIEESFDDSKK